MNKIILIGARIGAKTDNSSYNLGCWVFNEKQLRAWWKKQKDDDPDSKELLDIEDIIAQLKDNGVCRFNFAGFMVLIQTEEKSTKLGKQA